MQSVLNNVIISLCPSFICSAAVQGKDSLKLQIIKTLHTGLFFFFISSLLPFPEFISEICIQGYKTLCVTQRTTPTKKNVTCQVGRKPSSALYQLII